MQLTTFTDYALRSLMYMAAKPERLCSVRHIAEEFGISRNHLVKVVHRLAQLGFVLTSKGKGGGIKLAGDAKDLKLGDLVRCLEPNLHMAECFDREHNACRITTSCQLKHFLDEAKEAFLQTLNQYTLADTTRGVLWLREERAERASTYNGIS